jgi:RNA polymerase sigma factor (sigma-70 family)
VTPGALSLSLSGRRRQRAAGERIAELFEAHGRMVYGVCRLVLRDPTDAEDAAQQTFLSAYRGLLAGQEPRDPSAWLGTIARNECRSRLRARQTEPLSLVTEPSGDETAREVDRRAEAEAIAAALAELPSQERDAILLREFYGLSYAEVAAALGLTGAAVESLIFRSRRRLQEQLRPLRIALGALTLPPTLRNSLADSLPGFGGGGAGAGATAAAIAKLGATPLAAKLAATTLAVGTLGTVALEQRANHHPARAAQIAVATKTSKRPAARFHFPAPPPPRAEPVSHVSATKPVRHRHETSQQSTRGEGSSSSGPSRDGQDGTTSETVTQEPSRDHEHGDGGGDGSSSGSGGSGSDGGHDGSGSGSGDSSGSDSGSGSGSDSSGSGSGDGSGDGSGSGSSGG